MVFLFNINPKKYSFFAIVLQSFFLLFALVLIVQLVRLQIFDHNKLQEKAKQMRQPIRSFTFRGEITDRNGLRLASDATLYDIYAHPKYYDNKKNPPAKMAALLSPFLRQPSDVILEKLDKLDASTITLAKGMDRDTVTQIKKLQLRGLDLVKKSERVYPQGNLASHILGYVNPDANLFAGVEKTGSKDLEDLPNIQPVEYDGKGGVIYDFNTDPKYAAMPLTGKKLVLTIDASIQHVAETELSKMMVKTKAERGSVIVMNPKTGEIYGFAVLPSYNPNKYNKAKQSVIKNWVLSDVYPPGSTFKILTVASALETGSIAENEKFLDTGKIKIGEWTISNYDYAKKGAPGLIDLKYLFVHSSNVGSLKVSLKMPSVKHYNMLRLFGIGSKTGIDLPGESAGIIPPPKEWDNVKHATIGFGYSIASTPMQIASAVAAIANNGIWVTPHVIKYSKEESEKRLKTRMVLSPQTAITMTKLLESSIHASDSIAGKIPNYRVAGKTGTSRKPNPNGPGYLPGQVFTSFAGYFPAYDPKVLIMVIVDNPKGVEIWGSTVAGPIFNNVAIETARILNIKPDAPGLNFKKKEN
ncbi:MAG: penicillin-binding protein 2 [Candidatus Gastranaerophilales bacterium]|nr:penicillin-binding protein 2 [Candidatus Gastranaerophilales bacterium]